MAYTIKARYYAREDQFGESYIITSDNALLDTNFEVGKKVLITEIPNEPVHQTNRPESENIAKE